MTLKEAQDIVERNAPNGYYAAHYRQMEEDYLPELCRRIEGLPVGSVLDIGPGWGTMGVWLASRGWKTTLMDITPVEHYITQAMLDERGMEYWLCNVCSEPIPGAFDLVLMTQVLPHLKWRADRGIRNIAEMTAPGGRLICTALDRAKYPKVHPPYAHWRDVPEYRMGQPSPEMVVVMYDARELTELLSPHFNATVERPANSTCLFAEGTRK